MERHKKIKSQKNISKYPKEEKKRGWDEFMEILKIWM